MVAAWFEDPIGDPILTGLDEIVWRTARRVRTAGVRRSREALEGPEICDRVVTATAAGMADCDLVIVASRPKPDWEPGTVVFTADALSNRRTGGADGRGVSANAVCAHGASRPRGDSQIGAIRSARPRPIGETVTKKLDHSETAVSVSIRSEDARWSHPCIELQRSNQEQR